ncbi:hypothetical protein VF10_18100 [Nostoc linckia z13]|nr:hypothetical protein VF10_18100 [Nostoc linckia z13]
MLVYLVSLPSQYFTSNYRQKIYWAIAYCLFSPISNILVVRQVNLVGERGKGKGERGKGKGERVKGKG